MEATPTLVINYFSGFKQNLVPMFQRPYTWTEKQWKTLWEDVMVFYPANEAGDKGTHFMGAVVTMPARSVPVGVSKFLIIDGQQRLTTISLLMCAVRDHFGPDQAGSRRRIQQFYLTNDGSEGTEYFKLLPTQGDREAYASLINDSAAARPESQFKKAYDFFRRRLRDIYDEGERVDPKRILEIIEKRLMVVMINLSETDDPYLIFESLNFKGSPLEQADLVRNYFLMRFPVSEQQNVYDQLWLPMQTRLGSSLTEFMRHFLGAEGEEVRKGDVYAAIKRLVTDSDAASVRILMARMERLSVLYGRISSSERDPHSDMSRYFDHFKRLDFGSAYPLLLALYEDFADGQFGLAEFVSTVAVLHSFVIRRMVVGVPSNSLSGLFVTLCKSKPATENPAAWLSGSIGSEVRNRRWPGDDEFAECWVRSQLYGSRACQVVLECVEESFGHHEAVGFGQSSIEHVMPQTLSPEWHEMLGINAGADHVKWLHTIGNLTLTGYNPELSNRPYSEKAIMYGLSHFELNRYFAGHDQWTSAQIENRAKALYKTAVQLWPRPEIKAMDLPIAGPVSKKPPAAFHGDCVKIVQQHLGVHLAKLSKTRYQSGDSRIRLTCAVSAIHEESREVPYFWFGFHVSQLEFLKSGEIPYVCLGCSSAATTLLIPLASIVSVLDLMSVSTVAQHRHIVVQKKLGRFILRLLDGKDGPDLTDFNIAANSPTVE